MANNQDPSGNYDIYVVEREQPLLEFLLALPSLVLVSYFSSLKLIVLLLFIAVELPRVVRSAFTSVLLGRDNIHPP